MKEIKEYIRMYPGKSEVLLCIDTDQMNTNPTQAKEFEEIQKYVEQNKL